MRLPWLLAQSSRGGLGRALPGRASCSSRHCSTSNLPRGTVIYQDSAKHGYRVGKYVVPPHHFQSDLVDAQDPREVTLHDARRREQAFQLAIDGFELSTLETACTDFSNDEQVVKVYYPELRAAIAKATGATHVLACDHVLRREPLTSRDEAAVVQRVHADYTSDSAERRLQQLLEGGLYSFSAKKRLTKDQLEKLGACRHAIFTIWRGLSPVSASPLAFVEPSTVGKDERLYFDLVAMDEERDRENMTLSYKDSHRWWHFPNMQTDEVIIKKDFDSDPASPQGVYHAAAGGAAEGDRSSIEVRLLAFFDESVDKAAEAEMLSTKINMRQGRIIGMLPPHE